MRGVRSKTSSNAFFREMLIWLFFNDFANVPHLFRGSSQDKSKYYEHPPLVLFPKNEKKEQIRMSY
jgi:hypothetical protein